MSPAALLTAALLLASPGAPELARCAAVTLAPGQSWQQTIHRVQGGGEERWTVRYQVEATDGGPPAVAVAVLSAPTQTSLGSARLELGEPILAWSTGGPDQRWCDHGLPCRIKTVPLAGAQLGVVWTVPPTHHRYDPKDLALALATGWPVEAWAASTGRTPRVRIVRAKHLETPQGSATSYKVTVHAEVGSASMGHQVGDSTFDEAGELTVLDRSGLIASARLAGTLAVRVNGGAPRVAPVSIDVGLACPAP